MQDERAIEQVLIRYALACDTRDWPLMDTVFTEDAISVYGGQQTIPNRRTLVKVIRHHLQGCGPTQHLLGNFRITVEGDRAHCVCYVRAAHVGLGSRASMVYEVWGEYRDQLIRTTEGWRICEREMVIVNETGSRDVLQPG